MTTKGGIRGQRNINYVPREGASDEYLILKEHLDHILEAARHMPDPGKLIQPLGWTLVGIGGTAAVEAYNATNGTVHRHYYVLLSVLAFLAGAICLYCDWKMNKELRKHAKWLERYMLGLYQSFGITPPPGDPGFWRRTWGHLQDAWAWWSEIRAKKKAKKLRAARRKAKRP